MIGFGAAMFLPETLHHKLPNTLHEAKKFGKEQVSFVLKVELSDYILFF